MCYICFRIKNGLFGNVLEPDKPKREVLIIMEQKSPMFVSVKDFVKYSGLTEYCVRRLLRIEEFPKFRYGHTIRIPLEAAQQWLLNSQGTDLDTLYPACYK